MPTLIMLALVGFAAQLVDGSLGMAYGVTSTTLLLAIGTNPAAASATVHLAEIGTTLASGAAHWRFGNVDWKVVARVGFPGALGAFIGATFLSWLSTQHAGPIMSIVLLALGIYILNRFTFRGVSTKHLGKPLRRRFLAPLGLIAGFVDATGGGGWGPVGTPALLSSGRMEPRKVVGSIDASEFLVAVAASAGFLVGLGAAGIDFAMAGAILVGGVLAAPIAAWIVRIVPPRLLGSAVGGLIVFTNVRTLLRSDFVDASGSVLTLAYALVVTIWAAAIAWSVRAWRAEQAEQARIDAAHAQHAAQHAAAVRDDPDPEPELVSDRH